MGRTNRVEKGVVGVKDMLTTIYAALVANPTVLKNCGDRIKFYETPETTDMIKPFITISPVGPQDDAYGGSDMVLALTMTYQVDVESHNRKLVKLIQHEVKKEMKLLGFGQLTGGLDTYFNETKRFVDARRYRGNTKIYETNY